MRRGVREVVRAARGLPGVRSLVAALDRHWWKRTILRADLVDDDFVAAQVGRRVSSRRAVGRYVHGGFRNGFSLNPLASERTISRQLSDSDRVPALYAYLVNDRRLLDVSPVWDAPAYAARTPGALEDPAGPLGHAWRTARRRGRITLGRTEVAWTDVASAARRAALGLPADSGTVAQPPADVLFVCRIDSAEPDPDIALAVAADVADRIHARILIAVSEPTTDTLTQAHLLALTRSDWHVAVAPDGEIFPARLGQGVDVVVERGPSATIDASGIERLAAEGRSRRVAPLWLAPDGTVASTGMVRRQGRRHHLLAGHPAEDARRLGSSIDVDGVAGATRAWPVALGPEGIGSTLLDIVVHAAESPPPPARDGGTDTDLDALLNPIGFTVADGRSTGSLLLRRLPSQPLRWAIKTAAPAGHRGQAWGDEHFAQALARALRRADQEAVVDAYDARSRATSQFDDVVVVLRGPQRIDPPSTGVSILWIISHPDEITRDELAQFDHVFAASKSWAVEASRRFGIPVIPLLQCTDAERFRPTGARHDRGIVFVGTARGIRRPSVVGPLDAGIPVRVYGPDWRGYIPGAAIAATGVPNEALPALYESASVVLNDHWPAMRAAGFIANRPYDAVAAGGRVVSDHVDGLEELFGGAVLTYRTIPELISLLRGDLDDEFPPDDELAEISARIRRDHSFDARARTLIAAERRHR